MTDRLLALLVWLSMSAVCGIGWAQDASAPDAGNSSPTEPGPSASPAPSASEAPPGAPPAEAPAAETAPPLALPQEAPSKPPEPVEVTVRGDKPTDQAASAINYGRRELELRPRLRPGDIVEAVPGLFAVQHAGGGKANQYFLRGFDADHGTDVAFFVDGVPANMVSHAHGQGFADLHFLIPELVVSLDGFKGPYFAQYGDFATAGAVDMRLAETFEESYAQYTVGQYGIMRGLVIASPDLGGDWRTVLAAEAYKDDGPFINAERLRRFNVYARVTHDVGTNGKISMAWMSYGSGWRGSGQIPARAVCGEGESGAAPPSFYGQRCLDHFGYVDPTEGGDTQRHSVSVTYSTNTQDSDFRAMAYALRYDLALYSNFTFFKDDPVHGDEIEQDDDRTVLGADLRYRRRFEYSGIRATTTFGAQVRNDSIDNALWHDLRRERLDPRSAAHIVQSDVGIYAMGDVEPLPWLRLVAGLRGERLDVNVADRLEDTSTLGTKASGVDGTTQLLPKVSAIVSPAAQVALFANFGRGFHSNDARGVVKAVNAATLLTPATGYEAGVRVKPLRGLEVEGAAFVLDLDSELVWNGDDGTTSPSGRTRRQGVEIIGRYRVGNWLFADAEATFTRARYRENAGNGQAVALAPTRTFSAGIGARPRVGDFTPFAAVRVKAIAERPANEDSSLVAQGFTVVDANAGVRWKNIEAALDVQNVLDTKWREVQFANQSRLPFEPAPVSGIHYAPGWPRTVMGRATLYWQ